MNINDERNVELMNLYNKILKKIAAMYYTVHEIDLVNDTVIEINVSNDVAEYVTDGGNAARKMREVMLHTVISEDIERVLEFSNLNTLAGRMQGKLCLSEDFIGVNTGWFREKFIALEQDDKGFPTKVIHTTEVIDEQKRLEEELYTRQKKHSEIIHGLAGDFVSIYYVDTVTGHFDIYRRADDNAGLVEEEGPDEDYFECVVEQSKKIVMPDDFNYFMRKFNKDVIFNELKNKKSYRFTVRIIYHGEPKYFEYRFVRPITSGGEDMLIVGVYNVDEEVRAELKRQEQMRIARNRVCELKSQADKLDEEANKDVLTGLNNRRAYENYLAGDIIADKKYIYMIIDINGLKNVNDTLGHKAGDELLRGAAFCINTCLGSYGPVFRVGGDEFVAILYVDEDKINNIEDDFNNTVINWSGHTVKELSVAYGYVNRTEYPDMDIHDMVRIADKRMYNNKAEHYARKGIDRRGLQEAYGAVCRLYTKILKVNLTTDSFLVIQMDISEKDKKKEYGNSISGWLRGFAESGQVHEEDRDNFLHNTSVEYLRDYFRAGNTMLCIHYRRKTGDEFRHTMMEIIPAGEYTDSEQIVFLYVKNIDR